MEQQEEQVEGGATPPMPTVTGLGGGDGGARHVPKTAPPKRALLERQRQQENVAPQQQPTSELDKDAFPSFNNMKNKSQPSEREGSRAAARPLARRRKIPQTEPRRAIHRRHIDAQAEFSPDKNISEMAAFVRSNLKTMTNVIRQSGVKRSKELDRDQKLLLRSAGLSSQKKKQPPTSRDVPVSRKLEFDRLSNTSTSSSSATSSNGPNITTTTTEQETESDAAAVVVPTPTSAAVQQQKEADAEAEAETISKDRLRRIEERRLRDIIQAKEDEIERLQKELRLSDQIHEKNDIIERLKGEILELKEKVLLLQKENLILGGHVKMFTSVFVVQVIMLFAYLALVHHVQQQPTLDYYS